MRFKKSTIYLKVFNTIAKLIFFYPLEEYPIIIERLEEKIKSLYKEITLKNSKKAEFFFEFYPYRLNLFKNRKIKDVFSTHFLKFDEKKKKITTSLLIGISGFNEILLKIFISYILKEKNGWFLHSSANLVNNESFIFIAKSGGGKSTITKILHDQGCPTLSDDGVFIFEKDDQLFLFLFPYFQKEKWRKKFFLNKKILKLINQPIKIKKIFFLRKNTSNKVVKIRNLLSIINLISKNIYNIGFYDKNKKRFLKLITNIKNISYFLHFNKNIKKDSLLL